jgi:hypothetical protein
MDLEDVVNIAQVHLVTFLGLFALERHPDKLQKFKDNFRSYNSIICTEKDILDKNKANFTCFLKQRLEDVVRVCRQKAKNIKGIVAEEFLVFKGSKLPPNDIEELLEDYEKYGYRKLSPAAFKSIKKRMRNKQEGPVYLENGIWYVCVPIRKKTLSLSDFACNNYDPYDNLHNKNPEELLEMKQENGWEGKLVSFNMASDEERIDLIKNFVVNNMDNSSLKEEVRIAKRFLGVLE